MDRHDCRSWLSPWLQPWIADTSSITERPKYGHPDVDLEGGTIRAGACALSLARRRLSALAAAYTYALVVFGGIMRITGSGIDRGNDWLPDQRPNGRA